MFRPMNLFIRLLWLRLVGRFRSRSHLLGPVRTPFRVWPSDLDVLRHVNNGTYFSLLDLGRMDLLQRAGLLGELRRRGWYPVVTTESMGFRRPLTLGQRFDVETRVLGWDERSFYLHQRFIRGDEVVANGLVLGRFLRREGGSVRPSEVAAVAGQTESPELPDWARRLGGDMERLRVGEVGG